MRRWFKKEKDAILHLPVLPEVIIPDPEPKPKPPPPPEPKAQAGSAPFIAEEGPVPFVFIKSVSVKDPSIKKGERKTYKTQVQHKLSVDDAVRWHGKGYGFIMGEPREYFEMKDLLEVKEQQQDEDQVLQPGEGRAVPAGRGDLSL